ncbi:hypothetical protein EDD99_5414 [Streptomyces sp. 846.5]|nr:hypothetical protein [Streptomyces sp. 846.5]TDT97298.1 hypothetical protein EDD99_5414 [Streptomyces sp. 846.5]
MPHDSAPDLSLTDRQWDALGQLRRLQEQGQPAGRGTPGLHLAMLKPLAAAGLVDLEETGEQDRRGRQWTAGSLRPAATSWTRATPNPPSSDCPAAAAAWQGRGQAVRPCRGGDSAAGDGSGDFQGGC